MSIWEKIEEQLRIRNMTVYEASKKAGLGENTLYDLKSGRNKDPRWSTMCKIADALEVSLDVFRKE